MKREFEVSPSGRSALIVPVVLLVCVMAGVAVMALREDLRTAWLLPLMLLPFGLIVFSVRRRRVSLDDGVLTIAAGLNTRRTASGQLDLDAARVVDLRERTEWKPLLKLNGTSTFGYSAGHFRLRDRSPAFLLLTDRSRVLMLPEKSGKKLLLSLQQPQMLLDALRKGG